MIELLVVDDHTIFRAGIRRLMSDETDIRVTGEAADSAEALAAVREAADRKVGKARITLLRKAA